MIGNDRKRHIFKTITWRFTATLITVLVSWLLTKNVHIALNIGLVEVFIKMIAYYYHERIWFNRIRFKKEIHKPNNVFPCSELYKHSEREKMLNQNGVTLWFTGLSGSGKSTIALKVDEILRNKGFKTYILDGDNVRWGINADLSFNKNDREENIRRVSEIAKLFNDAGLIVISAFISPYEETREKAKTIIGEHAYKEIYVNTSLETCIDRDVKGLYEKAIQGKIKHFTGISDPYEEPQNPYITVDGNINTVENIEEQANKIVEELEDCLKLK